MKDVTVQFFNHISDYYKLCQRNEGTFRSYYVILVQEMLKFFGQFFPVFNIYF